MASPIRRDIGSGAAPIAGASRPLAVVAIGGNALTALDQRGTWEDIATNAAAIATSVAQLHRAGWRVAVVHGNGPQVGNLSIQQDEGAALVPAQPLHQLCAMTQGQLGSVLVREIDRLCGAGSAVALVTHVIIGLDDPAFHQPTKPIGPFFSGQQAAELAQQRGWHLVDDAGRGYRRVVPSPSPTGVVEMSAIRVLLDSDHIVLAAGGGGVAVSVGTEGGLTGVDAIIDKDHAAVVVACALDAREFYLLTGVDSVLLDFGTVNQRPVHDLTSEEAEQHLADGQFPSGSMGPKVTAALRFLRAGGERAIITSAQLLDAAAAGEAGVGTRIERAKASIVSAP